MLANTQKYFPTLKDGGGWRLISIVMIRKYK
jgi:hypothetical protein